MGATSLYHPAVRGVVNQAVGAKADAHNRKGEHEREARVLQTDECFACVELQMGSCGKCESNGMKWRRDIARSTFE